MGGGRAKDQIPHHRGHREHRGTGKWRKMNPLCSSLSCVVKRIWWVNLEAGMRDRLKPLHDPFFELFARTLGNVLEADAGATETGGPCHFAFGFHKNLGTGQRELDLADRILGQRSVEMNGHSTFAEIGSRGFQGFSLVEDHGYRHFERTAEVTALLADHEAHRGIEAAQ